METFAVAPDINKSLNRYKGLLRFTVVKSNHQRPQAPLPYPQAPEPGSRAAQRTLRTHQAEAAREARARARAP